MLKMLAEGLMRLETLRENNQVHSFSMKSDQHEGGGDDIFFHTPSCCRRTTSGPGAGQSITQSRTLLRGRKAADPGANVCCGMVRC